MKAILIKLFNLIKPFAPVLYAKWRARQAAKGRRP